MERFVMEPYILDSNTIQNELNLRAVVGKYRYYVFENQLTHWSHVMDSVRELVTEEIAPKVLDEGYYHRLKNHPRASEWFEFCTGGVKGNNLLKPIAENVVMIISCIREYLEEAEEKVIDLELDLEERSETTS